jgi:hypothetical protein
MTPDSIFLSVLGVAVVLAIGSVWGRVRWTWAD